MGSSFGTFESVSDDFGWEVFWVCLGVMVTRWEVFWVCLGKLMEVLDGS